jgi:hypothetical protein
VSLTDDPNDPRLTHGADTQPGPQNEVYLVLSEEDRAKGFVRPLRRAYVHVDGCGALTTPRPHGDRCARCEPGHRGGSDRPMTGAVTFTAPCDRCQTLARWTQGGNQVVVLPDDYHVRCPHCDEIEVTP